jgi:NADPH-dependent 2,4-dienoyl-CoA reductase/sulfur reductase-like enzyme
MKILVVGAVAAGTKTAAKLKRELGDTAEITVISKGKYISYAACGLPYYIGGVIKDRASLLENTPESYSRLTGVNLITGIEATKLDPAAKTVFARNVETGEELSYGYDKLVLTTGARPVVPNIPGMDLPGVYTLRDPDDADKIKAAAESGEVKRAVIVGGGMIGVEMAENLTNLGVRSSIIDMAPHILPGFDADFADFIENLLGEAGIPVFTNDSVTAIEGEGKVQKVRTGRRAVKTDMVIMAVGVRPNTEWLKDSGIEMTDRGVIVVNDYMQTSDPDIYSAGDCAMARSLITGKDMWTPMGSSANIEGRHCAKAVAGTARHPFRGVLQTIVLQLPGMRAGKTGFGIDAARAAGIDAEHVTITCYDKAKFFPGMEHFSIRMVAEKESRRLLGVQVLGKGNVDKIVDIGVAAISLGATLDSFDDMDFAYSPPFSTPIHPFAVAANALMNKMDGGLVGGTLEDLNVEDDWITLDVGKTPVVPTLRHVDVGAIDGVIDGVPTDAKIALVCLEGKNSYMAENRMKRYGYDRVYVVEGGTMFNKALEYNE